MSDPVVAPVVPIVPAVPEVVPAAPASPETILTTPPPAPPAPPEDTLFPKPPEPDAKEPPVVPPATPEAPKEPAKPADAKPATPAVPEDLKLPDGSLLSPEDLAEVKAKNLPKEQAETLIQSENAAVKRYADKQTQIVETAKADWIKQAEVDPVIGGEKFAENAALAQRGFQAIADVEITKFMKESGLGNHPLAIRMFAKLGKMFAEDRMIPGIGGLNPEKKKPEDIIYGNTPVTAEMH